VFLNLTNHPSSRWSDAQRTAAEQLATPVVDRRFPAVPADWDLGQVQRLALETVADLPHGITHALVSGEYTLTVSLVGLLQAHGVRCLAACAERDVVQIDAERKEQRFRFVRFRGYPAVGARTKNEETDE